MKNITLSAREHLIEAARRRALIQQDEQFRLWPEDYVQRPQQASIALETIRTLRGSLFTGGRKFAKDEMNER